MLVGTDPAAGTAALTPPQAGHVISQPDLWIAAITRAAGGILVTNNSDEFSRIPGLMVEDWLQS